MCSLAMPALAKMVKSWLPAFVLYTSINTGLDLVLTPMPRHDAKSWPIIVLNTMRALGKMPKATSPYNHKPMHISQSAQLCAIALLDFLPWSLNQVAPAKLGANTGLSYPTVLGYGARTITNLPHLFKPDVLVAHILKKS